MANTIYNWRDLDLQDGDKILCSGNSKMSNAIKKVQKYTGAKGIAAEMTHVAEVTTWMGGLAVYESTSMNKWANKSGVQMNTFKEWLHNYNGDVYIKRMSFDRTDSYLEASFDFEFNHRNYQYESGIPGAIELALCGLRLHRYVRWAFPDYTPRFTSEPHCTELIAKKAKFHGHLSIGVVENRVPPWLWWSEMDSNFRVPISEPIKIKELQL